MLIVGRIFVISVLVISAFFSVQWMMGDVYGERIALSLEQWNKEKTSPSQAVLLNHLEFSEKSLDWSPLNPRYKELRARLLVMQVRHIKDNQEVLASVDEMIELHRTAAKERPQWPFSWANLNFMKGVKKEFDDEYFQSLQKVVTYGPYEVGAIQQIVRSATRAWVEMDEREEHLIYQAITNGVEIDSRLARNLKKILEQDFILEDVCEEAVFHSDRSKERLCG